MMVFASDTQMKDSLRGKAAYVADMETYEIRYMTDELMTLLGLATHAGYQDKKCFQLLHE